MIKKKVNSGKIEIDLTGPQGQNLCKQVGIDSKPIMDEMMSGDYENLIEVFDKKFGSVVTMYK
jgi:hypothetical protein